MKKIKLILVFAGLLVLMSCTKYPPTSSRLLEDLAILTQYDVNTNFKAYTTFSIVDSVAYINGDDSGVYFDNDVKSLLDRIAWNMEKLGYQRKAKTENPDFGINVVLVKATNLVYYYPGWYWGYGGYYPPYWWGYPYYDYYYPYYPVYYTTYSSGTVIIDMVNFKALTPDNNVPVVWNAYIRALLTGNHTASDINAGIDQAFAQTKGF